MTTTKDLLTTKKNTLLTELESIKNLLDGQSTDNIPLLQDTIIPKEPEKQVVHTVTEGVLPGQRPLFNEAIVNESTFYKANSTAESESAQTLLTSSPNNHSLDETSITAETNSNSTVAVKTANTTSLSTNPFLPAHVRQRLQQDANNEQRNDNEKPKATVNASYTQRLVDQLVAHHLPKIEQELRRKLVEVVNNHNSILKNNT
jgi:hypothetical protein